MTLSPRAAVADCELRGVTLADFQILSELLRSTSGAVLKARHRRSGTVYILKEKHASELGRDHSLLHEVALLASIRHPNVIACPGWFWGAAPGAVAYIVLEYAERGDLQSLLASFSKARSAHEPRGVTPGGMPEPRVWAMLHDLCGGLAAVHAAGIIHRDLKPQNVFVSGSGVLKLGDFGISRLRSDATALVATFSYATPLYMSPEFIESRPYNDRTDMWALGILLYELLTLRTPFLGRSLGELVQCIQRGRYDRPKGYSKPLLALLDSLLQADYTQRPSAAKCLEYVHHFLHKDEEGEKEEKEAERDSGVSDFQIASTEAIVPPTEDKEKEKLVEEKEKVEKVEKVEKEKEERPQNPIVPLPPSGGSSSGVAGGSREERYRQRLAERQMSRGSESLPPPTSQSSSTSGGSSHPKSGVPSLSNVPQKQPPRLPLDLDSARSSPDDAQLPARGNGNVVMAQPRRSIWSSSSSSSSSSVSGAPQNESESDARRRLERRRREGPDGEMVGNLGAAAELRAYQQQMAQKSAAHHNPSSARGPAPAPQSSNPHPSSRGSIVNSSNASHANGNGNGSRASSQGHQRRFNILTNEWFDS